jgi:hypothetical protein
MNTFNVRNYTSTVPPARTAERIEAFLAGAGASHIAKHYDKGELVGIDFAIEVQDGVQIAFRLPVDVAAMSDYMLNQRLKTRRMTYLTQADKDRVREQAKRTAWRVMQDWVESQLSLVVTKQAEMAQVFMPYAFNGQQTYYASVKERGFAMLAAPKENQDHE